MPIDGYSHNFEFSIGDGGKFLIGNVEFNTDGNVSYKFKEISKPLNKEVFVRFNEMMELIKTMFHEFGGIKEIKIIEKSLEP